jgi:hypothetical protein
MTVPVVVCAAAIPAVSSIAVATLTDVFNHRMRVLLLPFDANCAARFRPVLAGARIGTIRDTSFSAGTELDIRLRNYPIDVVRQTRLDPLQSQSHVTNCLWIQIIGSLCIKPMRFSTFFAFGTAEAYFSRPINLSFRAANWILTGTCRRLIGLVSGRLGS